MSKTVVGLDIGSESIRAIEVSGVGSSRPTVLRYHEVVLPDGAVKSGEVAETNTVADALRQLWSAGKFRSKKVILGVGSSKVLVRDLTLPKLEPRELQLSIASHVQDMLPVPVADALLDFYPTSESGTPTGPVVTGLLVAAVKESVLANVKAVQRAGLVPVAVDLIPFALTRLHKGTGNLAFVDVGSRTTNVIVTSNGVPQFVRIIATGGHDLTSALSTRLQISMPEAELLKRTVGLDFTVTHPDQAMTVQIIREVTTDLLNSLRNTLAFYANTRQNEPYSGVVLTGGGSTLRGFAAALGEITRIQVSVIDPFSQVTLASQAQQPTVDRQAMNVALGLAMGSAA